MLTLTDKAAVKIATLLTGESKSTEEWGLRVAVEGGGCSGLSYRLDITKERPGDHVVSQGGSKLFIDARSLIYVNGSEVDYSDALTGAGFVVRNPQQKSSCGCGSSFSV